jgi:putative Mn2+ efflux pump MntP
MWLRLRMRRKQEERREEERVNRLYSLFRTHFLLYFLLPENLSHSYVKRLDVPGLDFSSLILLSVGLSTDVFSIACIVGFGIRNIKREQIAKIAFSFGVFHLLMPILGWVIGAVFIDLISGYDHWAAFLLLAFVGGRMLLNGIKNSEDNETNTNKILENQSLVLFSLAVSIDSVAIGLSFSLENIPILLPAVIIGITAFVFTFIGVIIGSRVGTKAGRWAEIIGGIILIGIGIQVLLNHIIS